MGGAAAGFVRWAQEHHSHSLSPILQKRAPRLREVKKVPPKVPQLVSGRCWTQARDHCYHDRCVPALSLTHSSGAAVVP